MFSRIFNSTPYILTTFAFTSIGGSLGMFDGIENSNERRYDTFQSLQEVVTKTTIGVVAGISWPISLPLVIIRNRMKKD